jgi:hypothetical protein
MRRSWARGYWSCQGTAALVIVAQLLALAFDLHQMMHFHEHPRWIMWLDALAIPLLAFNVVKLTQNAIELRKMERGHKQKMQQLYDAHKRWLDTERAGMEACIADIEKHDPARAASLRRRLREAEEALERAKPK